MKNSELKNSEALCNVGGCYYRGYGVEKNDKKCVQLTIESVE